MMELEYFNSRRSSVRFDLSASVGMLTTHVPRYLSRPRVVSDATRGTSMRHSLRNSMTPQGHDNIRIHKGHPRSPVALPNCSNRGYSKPSFSNFYTECSQLLREENILRAFVIQSVNKYFSFCFNFIVLYWVQDVVICLVGFLCRLLLVSQLFCSCQFKVYINKRRYVYLCFNL